MPNPKNKTPLPSKHTPLERGVLECLASGWSLQDTATELNEPLRKICTVCDQLQMANQFRSLGELRAWAEQTLTRPVRTKDAAA